MTVDYIGYIFAFCIAVGGIIGYVKAGDYFNFMNNLYIIRD